MYGATHRLENDSSGRNSSKQRYEKTDIKFTIWEDPDPEFPGVVSTQKWSQRALSTVAVFVMFMLLTTFMLHRAGLALRRYVSHDTDIKLRKWDDVRKVPHIIIILSDDQGIGDMDIPGSDFENLMPTIRSLSESGLNISQYYTAPLCTPARSSLMTGTILDRPEYRSTYHFSLIY
jgi:hypothetical protein